MQQNGQYKHLEPKAKQCLVDCICIYLPDMGAIAIEYIERCHIPTSHVPFLFCQINLDNICIYLPDMRAIAVEYMVLPVATYLQWDQPVMFHFLTVKYPLTMFDQNCYWWNQAKENENMHVPTFQLIHLRQNV